VRNSGELGSLSLVIGVYHSAKKSVSGAGCVRIHLTAQVLDDISLLNPPLRLCDFASRFLVQQWNHVARNKLKASYRAGVFLLYLA
jgi:hypothetical protein